jgi:hypothetical protein
MNARLPGLRRQMAVILTERALQPKLYTAYNKFGL